MSASEPVELSRLLPPSDEVAALGHSIGHLAHDFNNLLAAISGSASLIEMLNATHPDTPRHVRNIHAASARGAKIMQQLLALSSRTDAPLENVPVGELMQDAKNSAELTLGGSHATTFFAPEGLPDLPCDRRQVQLLLGQLVENARDAQPHGGAIVVTARTKTVSPDEVAHPGAAAGIAGDYLAFTVQDSGPGLDCASLARLGEPFFTSKAKGKGTGLGLAIVNRIVRRHGGFVLVESEAGAGTRVTCHFPLLAAGAI